MYSEVRVAILLLLTVATTVSGWFAATEISTRIAVLRTWQRSEGRLYTLASPNTVEIEFGRDTDERRVVAATVDHVLFLAGTERVTAYTDPSDPKRVRIGGLLQWWLWPATLALTAVVFCVVLGVTFSFVRSRDAGNAMATGKWSFASPPAEEPTQIVMHAPPSEAKWPLFWSVLGFAAFCCGVLITSMGPFQRLWSISAGGLFIMVTFMLSLYNYTLRISADSLGLRVTSALGWRDVPWKLVKGVELREVSPAVPYSINGKLLPFPGRTTRSYVFTGAGGNTLFRMSIHMQPPEDRRRFFELCRERTGLVEMFNHLYVPDI